MAREFILYKSTFHGSNKHYFIEPKDHYALAQKGAVRDRIIASYDNLETLARVVATEIRMRFKPEDVLTTLPAPRNTFQFDVVEVPVDAPTIREFKELYKQHDPIEKRMQSTG